MSSRFPPEVRFAKHRLLPEIGPAGQARLSESRFSIDPHDPAARHAAELLERSGLERSDTGDALSIESARSVEPALTEVDAAIRGALAAVARIRTIVGVPGAPPTLPRSDP